MRIPHGLRAALASQGAAPPSGYTIERSLRFNSADSAYLSRTPASAGNRKTWTWSGWVKKTKLGVRQTLFSAANYSPNNQTNIYLESDDTLLVNNVDSGTVSSSHKTSAVYRDVSAWAHIVVAYNTAAATNTDRVKLYVNGLQITDFSSSTYPAQNYNTHVNSTIGHGIGIVPAFNVNFLNGYLADIHFIDGQALTPSDFTETDATTGQLIPKAYTGTYGTNGFHLPFSDNSTAAALGTDTSGNSNTWTVNNISVAAGSGNDSLVDTPTSYGTDTGAGGEVRGNYATLNPLSNAAGALSDGNLRQAGTASVSVRTESTIAVSSGKWYFEVTPTALAGTFASLGIGTIGLTNKYPGEDANSYSWYPQYVNKQNSTAATSYGSAVGVNGVVMVAFDLDNNKIFFGGNGTWFGSSNPANGTNPAFTINAGTYTPIFRAYDTGSAFAVNFGQRPFAYTAPSGFKALCDTNLPTPAIAKPNTVMDVKLYPGNGSTQTISGLGFSPDLVWVKARSRNDVGAYLFDKVRGDDKYLSSGNTGAEGITTQFDLMADGFIADSNLAWNGNNDTYVAWNWDAGSSTVTNTDGSITSQVRANPSAGFSIVTYTGNGVAGATVGHGLGVSPSFIIVKTRNTTGNGWRVYHSALGNTKYIQLDSADIAYAYTDWNNTTPSSSVITLGASSPAPTNTNGNTYVAYCFAPVAGYSSFGRYTGNGSADGPFVYTGFSPAFVMIKRTDTASDWTVLDYKREGYNVDNDPLYPNLSNAEGTTDLLDINSNGFKLRSTDVSVNASSGTYIYAAFAKHPFQYARAR